MYILCIESSKTRGMGHLFRTLLYASYLHKKNISYLILINQDEKSIDILKSRKLPFEVVDYSDESDWITPMIQKYNVTVWLQDKFETSEELAKNIYKNKVLFCAIDEFGQGAEYCDIHFAGMIYLTGHEIRGKQIYKGSQYVILNEEINKFKRLRTEVNSVIVSLGGSDPFGMTVEVVKELNKTDLKVEIIIGPDFEYEQQLKDANTNSYPILQNVSSLIQEFSKFDFAITGGGVTCCEANSCGIPCMIIANAPHEMNTGKYMQGQGGAVYAGSFYGWDKQLIDGIRTLDIEKMSKSGMAYFDTKAIERIFTVIEHELERRNER